MEKTRHPEHGRQAGEVAGCVPTRECEAEMQVTDVAASMAGSTGESQVCTHRKESLLKRGFPRCAGGGREVPQMPLGFLEVSEQMEVA